MSEQTSRPPRDNLFRAVMPGVELRAAAPDGTSSDAPVMTGHFARWNEWTLIDSIFEGRFMERFAPSSMDKTMRENRASMRVLFQHGRDAMVGDKPLGPIDTLKRDDEGAFYEVPLLDAPYVRETLLPGLEAGLYGASFRFRVLREEINGEPGVSDHNPEGLPERTVKEAQVMEFGPVTFPAYEGATAGVRSMTDDFIVRALGQQPERLRKLLEHAAPLESSTPRDGTAPSDTGAAPERTPVRQERRDPTPGRYGLTTDSRRPSWAL